MKTKLNFIKTALLGAAVLHALTSVAQTFSTIRSFGILTNVTGFNPQSQLVQGPDGTLYGTTVYGEVNGTVFKINGDGSGFTVLKWFTNSVEGANPVAGVTLSGSTLYGTTSYGGNSGYGTVFKVNTDGTGFTVVKNFTGAINDGAFPNGGVILLGNTLFGATYQGGSLGYGTVFKVNTDGTSFTVLKSFSSSDGANPNAGVTLSGSTLYGTTYQGGSLGYGTVFKVNTNGSGFAVLKNFNFTDGQYPKADLTLSGSVIFGTTHDAGGSSGTGTLFKLNMDGTGFAVLKNFTYNNNDGGNPQAALTLSGSVLYGTTMAGGSSGYGTVFKVNTNGTGFTVLKNFSPNSSDGYHPEAGMALSGSTLYGTTYDGGSSRHGTVFKINIDGTDYTVLKDFIYSDGVNPGQSVTFSGGTLYGITQSGGSSNNGTVFKVNTDGTSYTVLKNFNITDGQFPHAGLALSGSTLYGTTTGGGSSNNGTVFKVNTDGTSFIVLKNFSFSSSDGYDPEAALTLSGNTLYGTTYSGGSSNTGTVFKVNTDGTGYAVLKNFSTPDYNASTTQYTNNDGGNPQAALTLSGSTLYGTTYNYGRLGYGTVFKVNTDGTGFAVLKSFSSSDGANTYAGVTLSGSTLYGTTPYGDFSGNGNVFKVNTDGTSFTVLKKFTNSFNPFAGVTLSGTTLYGTTRNGGTFGYGTVFQMNNDGTGYTVLKNFAVTEGNSPRASLTLVGNTLYGTTTSGGAFNNGTIFQIILPPPPSITNTLAGISVFAGTTTNFTVGVTGTAPFSYQWYFNNAPLATATNATLPFAPAVTNQTGNYFIIVTNDYGAVTSSVVTLTVVDPKPVITNQPPDQTLPIGNTASFSVAATGASPLAYQWSFNNGLYAGATNATLTFGPALTNQAGSYQVIITNLYGSATSRVAVLTVLLQPNAYGISNAMGGGGSSISLSLASIPNSISRVWASTNLVQWQPISTNVVGTNGLFQFTDTNLTGNPGKFYRVSTP